MIQKLHTHTHTHTGGDVAEQLNVLPEATAVVIHHSLGIAKGLQQRIHLEIPYSTRSVQHQSLHHGDPTWSQEFNISKP